MKVGRFGIGLAVSVCCILSVNAQDAGDLDSPDTQTIGGEVIENSQWLNQAAPDAGSEDAASMIENPPDTAIEQIVSASKTGGINKKDGKALQLGFVNFRRVMASIPQLSSLRARLDGEFAQQRRALDEQAEEIQQLENRLADMPRGDAYSELEKQVIAKRRTFVRFDASFRDAYSVRRNEELATLQQLVVDEIVALAKDDGYDVILNDTGVIYVSSEADLTQKIIERLENQAKQGKNGN